jgi:hypothetical protein
MKALFYLSFVFFTPLSILWAQEPTFNGLTIQDSSVLALVPDWVKPILEKSDLAKQHKILQTHNPFYFEQDFTGDKTIDIAFMVQNTTDQSKGLMLINADKNLIYIIGCGSPTDLGTSITGLQSWFVFREKSIRSPGGKTQAITAPGVLVRGKRNVAMVVYWSRNKYKTYLADE